MRKFIFAALSVLALGGSAQAALIVHVGDAFGAPGDTVTVDVWLEETDGSNFSTNAWSAGVRLQPTDTVTVQSVGQPVSHTAIFSETNRLDLTSGSYNADYDRFITNDGPTTAIENGSRDGLFSVTYSIGSGTLGGVYALNIDSALTEIADANNGGVPIAYSIDNGSISVVVPEPSAMALGLLALPLLARRRR